MDGANPNGTTMKTRLGAIVLAAAVTGVAGLSVSQTPLTPPAVSASRPGDAAGVPAAGVAATDVPATAAADIPVRQVVLFSSGVGYFEHYGTINGDGSAELRFKTAQINDILKSLLLQDMDGGRVTVVTYASQDPVDKTLKSFAVDITANPPLADLLNQLRGAKVTVTSNGDKVVGVVLGVEHKKVVVGDKTKADTVDQSVLNLVAGGKIVSQPMDAVNSIELDDPKLQDELNKALVALAGARDQDKKPVRISFAGKGERHVKLGYVVETPIWKTSYRLILGDKKLVPGQLQSATAAPAADGNLQGWALIENQTDNDWNNVELSLVSGRPISFIEDLYQPLYIPRPVVEPELFASLRPQTYLGATDYTGAPNLALQNATTQPASGEGQQSIFAGSAGRDAVTTREGGAGGSGGGGGQQGQGYVANLDPTASVKALASGTSLGELFEYTVGNVSLPRQRSAMIPIITDPVEVERLSIFNQSVLPRSPLNGARVKNTTKKHLLAGPVTVLDGASYAGDAQIDNIPPGQERLLSYGVDLQMLVDATDAVADQQLQSGKIVNGVLVLTNKNVRSQTYVAENKSDHDKTLIIEHPRDQGWELTGTPAPSEKTDSVWRFRMTVTPGKPATLVVNEQVTTDATVQILPSGLEPLLFYRSSGKLPKKVQDALAKAIDLKTAQTDTERQMVDARQVLADIDAEQTRIRQNLNTITRSGQYYTRLMTKLDDQETTIEKTRTAIDDLAKKRDSQQKQLEAYLTGLNVE
jgi:hypothetical protein